jgi:hypothetical protein
MKTDQMPASDFPMNRRQCKKADCVGFRKTSASLRRRLRATAPLLVSALFTAIAFGREQVFLGPQNSGAASGGANWFFGENGAGSATIDFDDAHNGGFDFVLSNSVAGTDNKVDWRCPPFSLKGAAGGSRPITFSFAYKLPDAVAKGNNLHVQLRFFDETGTNFISEHVFPIGAHSGDSRMKDYKERTIENIFAPPKARTADVWINANIFEPWVSGTARVGDFSVTTVPRSLASQAGIAAGLLAGGGALILLFTWLWRRRAPAHK